MNNRIIKTVFIVAFVILLSFSAVFAQKKLLTDEDVKKWERIGQTVLSDDGNWLAYTISLVDGDGWLMLKNVDSKAGQKFPVASRPVFTKDNDWFAFTIGLPKKERDKLQKAKKPVRNKVGLVRLGSTEIDTVTGVSSFGFTNDGDFLVMKKYKAEGKESRGSGLVYRNLETGIDQLIGDVAEHIFSEEGSYIALIKDAEEQFGNGIYLYNLGDGIVKGIETDRANYLSIAWDEDDTAVTFLKGTKNEDYEGDSHTVFAVSDIFSADPDIREFDPNDYSAFPEGYRIVGIERRPRWSKDGSAIFFGIKEWEMTEEAKEKKEKEAEKEIEEADPSKGGTSEEKEDVDKEEVDKEKEEEKDDDEEEDLPPPGVEVWHWKDVRIQPRQKRMENQDKNFNYLAVWHLDENKFVQISDEKVRTVSRTFGDKHAIGYDDKPYELTFKDSWRDAYIIDVETGDKEMFMQKVLGNVRSSEEGNYLLYFKKDDWFTYDIAKKVHTNLTKNIKSKFQNFENDSPRAEKPAWGVGQWFKDDAAVLLYDQYDIWKVTPDGKSAERLTEGAKDRIRYRQFWIDREIRFIDEDKPFYVVAYGDFTKDSGYYRYESGRNGDSLVKLIYEPGRISNLVKAEEADRFIFRKQKADMSPNVFVTDSDFSSPEPITDTNAMQKDFHWAGSELITFKNKRGKELQGSLLYPADYQPGKKYPMIVYIYEKRSQGLHNYVMPSLTRAYNQRMYSNLGFFVFEPDIVYQLRDPGVSAVECVIPAVKEVLKRGDIDKDRIGLTGHSWGAYQTAFIITQSDIFAAAVAGAPLINMISMYSSVYWNSGNTNQVIFETSQGRLPKPYWEDWKKYVDNSPVFGVKNITTPLLVAFGTDDGAVDFNQGVEMYNAMRRQQKEYVMLVYEGENHSNSKKENQLHYAKSAREWFLHFLQDEPAPDWITKGVSYADRPKKK